MPFSAYLRKSFLASARKSAVLILHSMSVECRPRQPMASGSSPCVASSVTMTELRRDSSHLEAAWTSWECVGVIGKNGVYLFYLKFTDAAPGGPLILLK